MRLIICHDNASRPQGPHYDYGRCKSFAEFNPLFLRSTIDGSDQDRAYLTLLDIGERAFEDREGMRVVGKKFDSAMAFHGSIRQTFNNIDDMRRRPTPSSYVCNLRGTVTSSLSTGKLANQCSFILPSSNFIEAVFRCYLLAGSSYGDDIRTD